jgi:glycosyltransferase involved in cell wall biosynthesis
MLSVVIPTYNRAATLDRVLGSIERQTVSPDEVIVVDDGSTDSTADVLACWESRLPLKVVHQENRGVSAARNTGIQAARSDIVAFIDSDDEYVPTAIETLKGLFEKKPAAIVAFSDAQLLEGARVVTASFLRRRLVTSGRDYEESAPAPRLIDPFGIVLEGAFMATFTCRKSALVSVGGYDESLSGVEDRDICLRLAMSVPGDWVFTWDRLETKHYTEGSLSSRARRRCHYECQLKVLEKFSNVPRFRTPEGKRLFEIAMKKSVNGVINWASREGPIQLIRTLLGIPSFARTAGAYRAAAMAVPISAARAMRDRFGAVMKNRQVRNTP